MILGFLNMVGPILLLSAEKRTKRLNVYGLRTYLWACDITVNFPGVTWGINI